MMLNIKATLYSDVVCVPQTMELDVFFMPPSSLAGDLQANLYIHSTHPGIVVGLEVKYKNVKNGFSDVVCGTQTTDYMCFHASLIPGL